MNIAALSGIRRIPVTLAFLVLGIWGTANVHGQSQAVTPVDKLDTAIKDLAEDIARYLDTEKEAGKEFCLRSFTGPNDTVNAKIGLLLRQNLEAKKFKFVSTGAYQIKGDVMIGDVEGEKGTRIDAHIHNRAGTRKHTLPVVFTERQATIDAFAVTAPTVTTPTASAPQPIDVNAAVANAVAGKNNIRVEGLADSIIKASKESPYAIELKVWTGTELVPVAAKFSDGRAEVAIQPEQQFAIVIHNQTPDFVGAHVALDGINMFHFSRNPAWQKGGIVAVRPGVQKPDAPFEPHQAILQGWHDDGDRSYRFMVTSYANSSAAKLGITEGVGNITVTFYRAVEVGKGKGAAPLGIGKGEEVQAPYKEVPMIFTDEVGAISVRYYRDTPPALPPGLSPLAQPKASAARTK